MSIQKSIYRVSMVCWVVVLLSGWAGICAAQSVPQSEMRGMWVTRFEWPRNDGNATAMKRQISTIMQTLADNNFNAVFFQVRGQADVLYPSKLEPWSALIGGRDPGFDPLAFAIEEAHKRGLEFHAYINAFPCWDKKDQAPSNPNHLYNTHKDWLCRNRNGNINYSEYYYFSPGIPEVQAHVRNVITDVVMRYNVDGIHLDRIRYPAGETSHDPISKARFEGNGNPGKLKWEDWQSAQISGFCNDLYGQISAIKPHVKLSSAVWGIYDRNQIPGYSGFSSGIHYYYQDSQGWIRMGSMDALVPMIYWDIGGKKPDYDELYRTFLQNSAGRHIYGGIQTKYNDPLEPIREIDYTRSVNGHGIVGFSYSGVNRQSGWQYYRKAYAQKVPVPQMPWKSNPQTGNIIGVVGGPNGGPVTDAWVRIEGVPATWLTSADGLFSILNLPPGSRYTVTVMGPGLGEKKFSNVMVEAGKTTRLSVHFQNTPGAAPSGGN